jgi:hypothetical protein
MLIVGCEPQDSKQEKIEENNKEVAGGGQVIATFPDGTKIRCYILNVPYVDNTWGNRKETYLVVEPKDPNSKSILINGQLYAPAEEDK